MYSRITASSLPTIDTKYSLARKIALLLPVDTGQVDRIFALDQTDDLQDRYFGGIEIII
jgi:hypothetical protein